VDTVQRAVPFGRKMLSPTYGGADAGVVTTDEKRTRSECNI